MFLLSEEEILLANEGEYVNWNVFSNFAGGADSNKRIENELKKARRYFSRMSDKELYKKRSDVYDFIITLLRTISDINGAILIVLAPFTLGISLISFLYSRLDSLIIETVDRQVLKKKVRDSIESLEDLKSKNLKKANEIQEVINDLKDLL